MPAGKFCTYKGRKQGRQVWRWKTVARNGRKTATGGEAFVNEADAVTGALVAARIIAEANESRRAQELLEWARDRVKT